MLGHKVHKDGRARSIESPSGCAQLDASSSADKANPACEGAALAMWYLKLSARIESARTRTVLSYKRHHKL